MLPDLSPGSAVAIAGAEDWAEMTKRTAEFLSPEKSRFTLNGMKLEIGERGGRMVATDGHKLSLVERGGCVGKFNAFIPARLVLSKAAAGGDVELYEDDNHIQVNVSGRRVVVRKLSGTFPDYERVIPYKSKAPVLEVDAAALLAAAERAGKVIGKKEHCRPVVVNLNGCASVQVQEGYQKIVKYQEDVPAQWGGQTDTPMKVDVDYLGVVLRAVGPGMVSLRVPVSQGEGGTPRVDGAILAKGVEGVTVVLMPIRW